MSQLSEEGQFTVFAPSDDAMDMFQGIKDENFILNHMVSSAIATAEMGERLTSLMPGHPPIWVRMITSNLYVNQARVVFTFALESSSGKKQFLYLIDSVLEPLVPTDDKIEDFVDIKAGDLLTNSGSYKIGDFSTKKFAERLETLGLGKGNFTEFNSFGKFTFFLPIDSAFENLTLSTIDYEVVRAHMVPDRLMFTKPQKRRVESMPTVQYNASRGSSNLRVMAKVFVKDNVPMVESQTVVGTKAHKRGTVDAKIVLANIPVQNGIVHLIDRPLVVMAATLWEHLCTEKTGKHNMRFRDFAKYLQKTPKLCERINKTSDATLLVPTNEAFRFLSASEMDGKISADAERILGLHFIEHPPAILADDVRVTNPQDDSGMFSVPALFPEDSEERVWFWNKDGKLHIDGGGIEAEVVEANVGASNGVIHSINRVLGIPQDTIERKLARDPMMSKTFDLGKQEHFNDQLNKTELQFTFLVPTDQAWDQIKKDFATAYKVLFMGDFFYQVHHILERHLQVGAKLSINELVKASQEGKGFEVMRGSPLQLSTQEENGEMVTTVSKDGIVARVVRANIECTNGYIHLIDKVVMKRRDVTLGGGANVLPSIIALFIPWTVLSLLH
eukprot:TRINITY_DN2142_c0_g1_i1.p1 TRINITY_DN2142_c0_g1~~TRINITY_DN2142_c0_g1_i1.p1  ORF type:complete len:616 (-),score=157.05 TRINITY_DN2142_c0_g1_i1:467-2314(-)